MGFLVGLILLVLFFRVFVGISVGLFKLLIGLVVLVALITLAPIGFVALGLLIPIIILGALFALVGFIFRLIF